MNRLSILVLGSGLHGLAGEERGFVVPQAGGSIAPAAVMQAADWKMTSVVDVDVESVTLLHNQNGCRARWAGDIAGHERGDVQRRCRSRARRCPAGPRVSISKTDDGNEKLSTI